MNFFWLFPTSSDLIGNPELRKTLRLKKYEPTVQRIGMQYHLQGLTKEETYGNQIRMNSILIDCQVGDHCHGYLHVKTLQ